MTAHDATDAPHAHPDRQFTLSVVIPGYNNGAALDITLDALTRQSLPTDAFEDILRPQLDLTVTRHGEVTILSLRSPRVR